MQALLPVLQHSLDGVVRFEVQHRRCRRFRWLFLAEFAIWLGLTIIIIIPMLIVFWFVSDSASDLTLPDFDSLGRRAWIRWRETSVRLIDVQGNVVAQSDARIESTQQGDQMLGQILAHAHSGRLAVVERLERGVVSAVWFGGQPLMLGPEHVDEARAWRILQSEGGSQESDGPGRCSITLTRPPPSRIGSLLHALVMFPFLLWSVAGREQLAQSIAGIRQHPTRVCFDIDADGIVYRSTRGPHELERRRIDRADLLCIGHAAILTAGPRVETRGPFLRLHTAQSALVLDAVRDPETGRALRDALVSAAHRLWNGLSSSGAPAHCPYCATLYPYAPGTACPSCGAPPTALHGLAAPAPRST